MFEIGRVGSRRTRAAGVAMSTPPLAPTGMASGPFGGPQAQQAAREVNTATLCRIGQETVQDIVYRTMEIFQLLRNMQVGAWRDRAGESGPPRATSRWLCRLYTPGPQHVSALALRDHWCGDPTSSLPQTRKTSGWPSCFTPLVASIYLSQAWTHPLTPKVPSMHLSPDQGYLRWTPRYTQCSQHESAS